ncbi:hypothetical protein MLD38_027970 [Melastoma candidum]|uniref:Uncharacterized protein n=1 Tax=Melastoma candidum TaxID=119954 RepID=A0ACB9N5N5_9MYRT|nr:hypothetical protein MLD38_027970 [Melastoma candidum]
MDSINNFFSKGYGKLSNPSDAFPPPPPPPQPSRDRRHLLVVSSIFLLTLSLLFLLGALIHESTTEPPPESTNLLSSNVTSSILFVCRSTHHPDSCFHSIASSVNGSTTYPGDPVSILRLSLAVCSRELDKLSGSLAELGRGGSSNAGSRAAVEDCLAQIEDAASRVADSVRRIGVDGGIPNDDVMADVATWMSAAMTDGETCVDGLEESGSTAGADDQVKEGMRKAREYMSNSLAIAVNLKKIVREFDAELH